MSGLQSIFQSAMENHLHLVPHVHPHAAPRNASLFFDGLSLSHTWVYLAAVLFGLVALTAMVWFKPKKKALNSVSDLVTKSSSSLAFVFCLLTATAFVGCTGKNSDSSSTASTQRSREENLKGKVLRLMLKDNVKSGDPASILDVVSGEVINQIIEPLYEYDYFSATTKLKPLLAESMPVYSKDLKTLTIKLKKGVLFHNDPCFKDGKGREFTAQDVLFSWKRLALTDTHAEGLFIFDGHVEGFHDFIAKYKSLKSSDEKALSDLADLPLPGLQALDPYTVQIKLEKPYPQLVYLLAHNLSAPIAREALQKYGPEIINHPVGTGPFKVTAWEPQNKIILSKSENFREELFPTDIAPQFASSKKYSGQRLPLVDHVVYRVIHEEQPRWLEYIDGNLDVIEIPKDNISVALDAQDPTKLADQWRKKGLDVSIDKNSNVYWYIFFNMRDSILGQNKYLRQALSSALDRKEWLRLFRNDRGDIATELNPLGVVDRCGKKALAFGFDLERAKKLLAQAGFPGGKGLPTLKFDLRGANTANRQIGEFVKRSLEAIGVKVDVVANTFPAFLDKRNKKNLQIAYGGWVMDYPDPENNFALYYSKNEAPGPNESNFNNQAFDALYDKFAAMAPGPARKKAVCELEDLLADEMPAAFGFYENVYRAHSKRIRNFHAAEMIFNKYKFADVVDKP